MTGAPVNAAEPVLDGARALDLTPPGFALVCSDVSDRVNGRDGWVSGRAIFAPDTGLPSASRAAWICCGVALAVLIPFAPVSGELMFVPRFTFALAIFPDTT